MNFGRNRDKQQQDLRRGSFVDGPAPAGAEGRLASTILSTQGETSLFELARRGKKDEVLVLLKNEGKEALLMRDKEDQTILHVIAFHGQYDILKELLSNRNYRSALDLNARDKNSWTPLHCAASTGHVRISELLLKEGADPTITTQDGANVLHYITKGWDDNISPR
ncbi:hypothetical protein HMI54_011811 [Coelomomyces lativittatus]|nr:hypothetical protein HMI54_011811 [Coelomomyces lativittatus]